MSLTILQIIDHALEQAQLDSSFRGRARLWYNRIVLKRAQRQDYNFYRKHEDFTYVPGQKNYALPADFLRSDAAYVLTSTGGQGGMLPILEAYQFDQFPSSPNSSGMPSLAYIDRRTKEIVMNTTPGANVGSQGFRLFYFKAPKQIDLAGADDGDISDFEDQETLIEELIAMGFEFDDDERQRSKKQEVNEANALFQRNNYENDALSSMNLNQMYFRPNNRRLRRRGFKS